MDILQVEGPLVCTQRIPGLKHIGLRVLRDAKGGDRRVRIVWARRVAEYVQMLGLEEVTEN